MAPEQRRAIILDAAAALVSDEGVSAVTFERLAGAARVSKALIYNYFGNRSTLLAALLLREYPAFHDIPPEQDEPPIGFEDLVRATTRAYLEHVAAKGILLQRLLAESSVASDVASAHRRGREMTARHFGARITREFGVPVDQATQVADLLMGVTGSAGNLLFRGRHDVEALTALVVRIIMAAVRETARAVSRHVSPPVRAAR